MPTSTLPKAETFSRDQHLSCGQKQVRIAPFVEVPQAASPEKAGIPSLKPDLYIYDIKTLSEDVSSARGAKVEKLQAIKDPDAQALTKGFLEAMIGRDDRLLDQLDSLAEKGQTRFISPNDLEISTPQSFAYEVKTLRKVFEVAHNYAHQRVQDAREANSCFLGAYENTLREVALDHVAALNSREAGHQYLETELPLYSTIVRCTPAIPATQATLSNQRKQGLAYPAVFHF